MQKYTAIILASRDVNEVNRLYIMYTLEQGLVKAVAKGARRPAAKLAGHLEPGTLSEVYVAKSRGMGQITSAITLENFGNVKNDFEKLAEFLKISRFFLKNFSEGEKDEKIFRLLEEFLDILNQGDWLARNASLACPKLQHRCRRASASSPARNAIVAGGRSDAGEGEKGKILIEAFWWKLFDALGNRPEILRCVVCGERLRAGDAAFDSKLGFSPPTLRRGSSRSNLKKYFSVEKGGAVCGDCGPSFQGLFPISDNQIKLLRIFWGNSFEKIAKVNVSKEELERLGKIRENFKKYNF